MLYPMVEQVTVCGQRGTDKCGHGSFKIKCNQCDKDEEWKYFESDYDAVNNNMRCCSEFKPLYRVKTLPGIKDRVKCCSGNGNNEICGGMLCKNSDACDKIIRDYCLVPANGNDPICVNLCSSEDAPSWCDEFAQKNCNADNFKSSKVCNAFCPLKDIQNREPWCDDVADEYCDKHVGDPFCSCFGDNQKICFDSTCKTYGYVPASASKVNCANSGSMKNIIVIFYIMCILIFLFIAFIIFLF